MNKRVVSVAAVALLLAGCGGGGPQGSSGSKLSGDRIVLGVLNDQSGVYL
ncbi:branched-chain amino acid ABC transporter substrate-binding protein, partial [Asanoa sp. NPDC050611]